MKILDFYIIKKFLATFFTAISLIIIIVVVVDISENIQDFLDGKAPVKEIITDYYFNFIPYFVNLFSPLFTFIAVIFFTSKLATAMTCAALLPVPDDNRMTRGVAIFPAPSPILP